MMYGVLTLLPLFYFQKTTNIAVNISLASVINNWNDFSKYFYELLKSYTNCCIQYDLLIWVINMIIKLLRTALILFGDRSLSSIFFSCFGFCSTTQEYLQLLNTSHIYLSYKQSFVTLCRTWGSLCRTRVFKLNHVLKTDGDKLFKDLLTNKIFSRQILSWNVKMELCLNRWLAWEFLGWTLIILTVFFCKITIHWIVLQFWAKTRQQYDK